MHPRPLSPRTAHCPSSDDDDLDSPTAVLDAAVCVRDPLLGGDGGIVRHVDSFVRSTRSDQADDQGSPRSRRLTFEFRNFNLYPDPRDGQRSPGFLDKHRPSRSLDICDAVYSPFGAYGLGNMAPQSPPPLLPPLPPIQSRQTDPPLSAYRSTHQSHPFRPVPNPRRNSDVGPLVYREKRVVTLREAVPVSIRSQDEEGSSELSEPEDADGPSGDSSVTSGGTRQHQQQRRKPTRARKKKPYKSRRCDICNKTFTKECDVTRHRRTAHGEDEIEFKCHECGRLFNRKDALERHYKVYEGTPHVARRYQPKTYLGQVKKG
ncbi:hypothetical protein CTheo_28 [Ceratobasidium theobromae]|uniref:C2H2-type domain-containing protein n=1 Tax=Ceratobasidium theobromae TaxID=1582974 RepID=A0A5N5QXQ9_9AGAM|nr:hypothetical protein CTheo_28 [Ceratobasidium theobromae]